MKKCHLLIFPNVLKNKPFFQFILLFFHAIINTFRSFMAVRLINMKVFDRAIKMKVSVKSIFNQDV